tara:strand:+ start:1398 stop:2444 length:1047 start_codon:yes stop_codon:yes gene_type:complete
MFRLEQIEFLYGLAALPVFWLMTWLVMRWKKAKRKAFADAGLLKQLSTGYARSAYIWKSIFFSLSYAFLILALANPQIGSKTEEVKREGVDIMICLDVSNSMLAEDLSPNRLKRAKLAMSQLVDRLKGDRIGIVVFAGQAFVQLPITTDYAAAKLFLNTVDNNTVAVQGTNIGAAIELATESFGSKEQQNGSRAIIVITDGENHEENAVVAAENAREQGIRVFTIGMGSEKGSPIPEKYGNKTIGFLKDRTGETIITQLNSETLKEIADAGDGFFQRATNADAGLDAIFDEISGMEKAEFGSQLVTDYEDRYPFALAASIFFLLLDLWLANVRPRWLNKLNLFGEHHE